MKKEKYIDRIREFNRFYTVTLGMVGRTYKESYSIAESRILYEILTNPGCTAGYLVQRMQLDKGYVSRILKQFQKEELITRSPSAQDARVSLLHLTAQGQKEAELIIGETNAQIGKMLESIDEAGCEEICRAMDLITAYFGENSAEEGGNDR